MAGDLAPDVGHVFEHTASVWQELAGANILITGAAGFIGKWLVESFIHARQQLNLNARLFVLGHHDTRFLRERHLDIISGDVKSFSFPAQAMHYVVHAAFEHEGPDLSAKDSVSANIAGTRRIIELMKMHETCRMLYLSSGAVYGAQPVEIERLTEDFNTTSQPVNSYTQAKRECEKLCRSTGLDIVIARLFSFVGPHLPLDRNFAVGNFIRDSLSGRPIRLEGDGTPLRSYLYAADLAVWLWRLLVHGAGTQPYNVGSDRAVSILELARTVEKVCKVGAGISVAQSPTPGAKPKRYVPSIDKARNELRLEPWVPLEDSIRRTFNWAQASMK